MAKKKSRRYGEIHLISGGLPFPLDYLLGIREG
jgi:hypothetical protein